MSASETILRHLLVRQPLLQVMSFAIAMVLFLVDIILPRGATPAIGYCLVPVLAAGARRRDFLIAMTIACTALTWGAFFVEPRGSVAWISAFERAMVTGVLWLTFLLISRRAQAIAALALQSRALEKAKTELERSNAELERFASVVAHDIRGPLNTIGLFAQLLGDRDAGQSDAEVAEYAGNIRSELASLGALIQSLLSYAHIGSGQVQLATCDSAAVLESVRHKLKSELDRHGAVITSDPLPTLAADPTLLTQLFQNLVENSLKYHGDAIPRIHVSATRDSLYWRFLVRDNGIGIHPGDVERAFKPFHQLLRGKEHRGGVGLGLASCKRIVERHGGQIDVVPSHGEGATLMFTIPIEAGPSS